MKEYMWEPFTHDKAVTDGLSGPALKAFWDIQNEELQAFITKLGPTRLGNGVEQAVQTIRRRAYRRWCKLGYPR